MDFGLAPTVSVLITAVLLAVFCGWRGARPWDIRKGPRMMPWRFLMLLCVTVVIVMLVHLLNLVGMPTGQNQPRYEMPR